MANNNKIKALLIACGVALLHPTSSQAMTNIHPHIKNNSHSKPYCCSPNKNKFLNKKKKKLQHVRNNIASKVFNSAYSLRTMIGRGVASWYGLGDGLQGAITASGVPLNTYALVAAHKYLPLGSYVRVVNEVNKKSVVVKIVDRGPFVAGRIIDLSYAAKNALGMGGTGMVSLYAQ